MASINASSSGAGGLITTGDSSGALDIQTAGTTAIAISSSQAVTIQGLTVGRGAGAIATNTAVGNAALTSNTTGVANTGVGYFAAISTTTGNFNSANGYQALQGNTTGANNTALGAQALLSNTTASNNTAVGYQALYSNTTSATHTALGYQAAYANTTGSGITAIGERALTANTTGNFNVAVGGVALLSNTTGVGNSAFGLGALQNNTTASNNTAVGFQAGYTLTTGATNNTFVGYQAGYSTITSGSNQFFGYNSGKDVTTGYYNTILGAYSGNQGGLDIRTANNYIVLSDGQGNPRQITDPNGVAFFNTSGTSITNGGTTIIGPNASGSPRIEVGHPSSTSSGGAYATFRFNGTDIGSITQNGTTGVLYNTSSDYRLKDNPQPLTGAKEFILALQPKTWTWKTDGSKGTGFIAHEAQVVATQSVAGEKDAIGEDGKPAYQSMQAGSPEIIANLVSLVQQLTAEVDSLKQQINNGV